MANILIAAEINLDAREVTAFHVYDPETKDKVKIELPAEIAAGLASMFCHLVAMAASPNHDEALRCLYLEDRPLTDGST